MSVSEALLWPRNESEIEGARVLARLFASPLCVACVRVCVCAPPGTAHRQRELLWIATE